VKKDSDPGSAQVGWYKPVSHRIPAWSGLTGPSVGHPAQPPAQAGSPRAGCTTPHPGRAGISPEKETVSTAFVGDVTFPWLVVGCSKLPRVPAAGGVQRCEPRGASVAPSEPQPCGEPSSALPSNAPHHWEREKTAWGGVVGPFQGWWEQSPFLFINPISVTEVTV